MNDKINLRSLKRPIDKTAFELFRAWTKNAKVHYPDFDFFIEDETCLVADLKESLSDALIELKRRPPQKNDRDKYWNAGFLRGFIEGNLNSTWYYKHILRKLKSYKSALWLKSMIVYLDVDKATLMRINRLYQAYLDCGFPFEEIDKTAYDDSALMSHRVIADLHWEENWQLNKPYLEKLLNDDFQRILEIDKKNYLPALEHYFTDEEIFELLATNNP